MKKKEKREENERKGLTLTGLLMEGLSKLFQKARSVTIFGAIDLGDHDQSHIIPDVQRFLDIESAAGRSNFVPYLAALSDRIPWIRDLSAHRLVQSDACNASPACQEAFLSTTKSLLHSKRLGERWEALQWTEPLALPMGDRNVFPRCPMLLCANCLSRLFRTRICG
jgi:hypothetical protein